MDKTGKIGFAVMLAILIAWMVFESNHPPAPPNSAGAPSATPAPGGATPPGQASGSSAAPETVKPAVSAPIPETVLPEKTEEIDTSLVNFTFTNHGGGIARAELNTNFVDDESKKKIVLNEYGVAPIGAISDKPGIGADASFVTGEVGKDGITFVRTTPEQVQITKKFTVPTSGSEVDLYIATLDVAFTNRGSQPYKSDGYYIHLGSAAPIHESDNKERYISLDWYRNGSARTINVLGDFNAKKIPLLGIQTAAEKTENLVSSDNIAWAGVYNQYFTTIITPSGGGATSAWADRIPIDIPTHTRVPTVTAGPQLAPTWYAINGALGMPGFELKPGETYSKQFQIYAGTRQYQMLKHLEQGQAEILHMGYSAPISKLLLKMLIWLKKVVHSYAVAIILLTIAIKALMWPLQNRSTQSMKRMQVLAPKMNELREKYKDDAVKYNQEIMKVYKDYGLSPWAPLAGCLPALIQLPIFVGFYSMLGSAIELRNSTFFWVHDLSQPDTVGHLPYLGYAINVLPLCMAATSAWMMSMTPKTGDAASQRMMYFMPLMFLWICYSYASGLALYMMVSNLFSVVQFILTKNQTPPALQKVAAAGRKKR